MIDTKQIAKNVIEINSEKTNFPSSGDDQKISLSNSKFKQAPYALAKSIKDNYPSLWSKYGTGGSGPDKTSFTGSNAFNMWTKYRNGERTPAVLSWVKRRERYMSRHRGDSRIAGVVSALKWGGVLDIGISRMREILSEEKKKIDKKKK